MMATARELVEHGVKVVDRNAMQAIARENEDSRFNRRRELSSKSTGR